MLAGHHQQLKRQALLAERAHCMRQRRPVTVTGTDSVTATVTVAVSVAVPVAVVAAVTVAIAVAVPVRVAVAVADSSVALPWSATHIECGQTVARRRIEG